MRAICISLLIFACVFASDNSLATSSYSGIRYTVEKGTVEALQLATFADMSKKAVGLMWPDLKEEIDLGLGNIIFTLTNIRISAGNYNVTKVIKKEMTILERGIVFNQTGPVLTMQVSFDYDFSLFDMHIFYGKGTVDLTSVTVVLGESFMKRELIPTFAGEWIIKYAVGGFDLLGGITAWVDRLFRGQQLIKLNKDLGTLCGALIVEVLKEWTDLKISLYPDPWVLTMLLKNNLVSMNEYQSGYVTLGYQTELYVEDRPVFKNITRIITSPVVKEGERCRVCVSGSILANLLELQSKAKDFIFPIDASKIGLTGRLRDLGSIMPKIYEYWDPELETYFGCRPLSDRGIVRLVGGDGSKIKFQAGISCAFGIKDLAKDVLSIEIIARGDITKEFILQVDAFAVRGRVTTPYLYNMKVASSACPVEQLDTLYVLAGRIASLLKDFPVIKSGLKIPVNVPGDKVTIIPGIEEDCYVKLSS